MSNYLQDLINKGELPRSRFKNKVLLEYLLTTLVLEPSTKKSRKYYVLKDKEAFISHALNNHDLDTIFTTISLPIELQDCLQQHMVVIPTKTPKAIIEHLKQQLTFIQQGQSIKEMSAILFWGLSKILDKYPLLVEYLQATTTPILVNAYSYTTHFTRVIFVENYTTYTKLISSKDDALYIYSAGYSLSHESIKKRAVFHFAHNARGKDKALDFFNGKDFLPCFFYGDFDFDGIQIFLTLKNTFLDITLDPRYEIMKEYVLQGLGHTPKMAKKENQKRPATTHDTYLESLLDTMSTHGFFDQEGVL